VTWLHSNEVVQQLSQNVHLYDLSQMRGSGAVLRRIPSNVGGIYAWYRRFELDSLAKDDPEVFVKYIIEELYKKHSASRETSLPPAYRITLQPETSFSKELLLKELAKDSAFRQLLFMLLNNSLIFQHPLYIGKAQNLYSRIRCHLREGSILRERFAGAGHDINRCRLLLIQNFSQNFDTPKTILVEDEELDEELEFSEFAAEQLVEDILSRLFLPSFTLRYG
jgi:hypothetical protein